MMNKMEIPLWGMAVCLLSKRRFLAPIFLTLVSAAAFIQNSIFHSPKGKLKPLNLKF